MQFLKKYWPTISAVLSGFLTFILPSLQQVVSAYPKTAAGVLSGCIIAAYHSTAPKDK